MARDQLCFLDSRLVPFSSSEQSKVLVITEAPRYVTNRIQAEQAGKVL